MKQILQYLWIERYGCIEKQGYNFSSRVNIKFDYEKNKLSIDDNSKSYCENFFGENIEVSCIVGKNGSGKTTLLEFIMNITDNKELLSNCIMAFYDSDSLIVYHTGIVKECKVECKVDYKEFPKNDDSKYVIGNTIDSDIIYYTYAFNFNQFNQQYTNVQNYSLAYLLNNNTELINNEQGDVIQSTDVNKSYNSIIHNQLDFVCKHKDFWKEFGIRKPSNMNIYIKKSRTNALLTFADKYYKEKEEIIKQIERFAKLGVDYSECKNYYEECQKIESDFDINELCRNFFDSKSSICFENVINNIAIELMNSFLVELHQFETFCWNTVPTSFSPLYFLRYLNKVYLDNINSETGYITLKRLHSFFIGVKETSFCDSYLIPPRAEGEKWLMWNVDKYKKYTEYLLEFINSSGKYVTCDSDFSFSISIDNEDAIANPIRFYDEYYSVSKVFDFLSFSYGLSSGEMALLNILSSLYKSICKRINPYKIEKESANFIIMIDEADMLLHPEWQRKFINTLVSFFKPFSENFTIQLLIATHSPIMLSDIPKQNVVYLSSNELEEKKEQPETFGSNIFKLYNNAFFLDKGAIGAFAKEKLEKLLKEILDGNGNKVDLQRRIKLIGDDFLRERFQSQFDAIYNKTKSIDDEIKKLEEKVAELKEIRDGMKECDQKEKVDRKAYLSEEGD